MPHPAPGIWTRALHVVPLGLALTLLFVILLKSEEPVDSGPGIRTLLIQGTETSGTDALGVTPSGPEGIDHVHSVSTHISEQLPLEIESILRRVLERAQRDSDSSLASILAELHRRIYESADRREILERILALAASNDVSEDARCVLYMLLGLLDEAAQLGDWVARVVSARPQQSQHLVRVLMLASTLRDENANGPNTGIGNAEKLWKHVVDYLRTRELLGLPHLAMGESPPDVTGGRPNLRTCIPDTAWGPDVSELSPRHKNIELRGAVQLLHRAFAESPTKNNPLFPYFRYVDYSRYDDHELRALASYFQNLGPDAALLYVDTFSASGEEDRLTLLAAIVQTDLDPIAREQAVRAVGSSERGRRIMTHTFSEIKGAGPRRAVIETIALKAEDALVREFLSAVVEDSSLDIEDRLFAISRLSSRLPLSPWAVELLSRTSHDREPHVRIASARTLARVIGDDARPHIEHLIYDRSSEVREAITGLFHRRRNPD